MSKFKQYFFTNFPTNRLLSFKHIVNMLIVLFFILSIWIICSVEVELFDKIGTDLFSQKTCHSVNKIIINLAYSYSAGIIIFLFTVVIPEQNRRRMYKPLVNNIIQEYCKCVMYQYFQFCADSDDEIPESVNDPYIMKYRTEMFQTFYKVSWKPPLLNRNLNTRSGNLRETSERNKSFINAIIPYENYLTDSQLKIINDIRMKQFNIFFDSDINGIDNGSLRKIYIVYRDLIVLINKVYETSC